MKIILSSKIAKFMYLLNEKNEPDIGIWSMRNIRKLFRRLKNQKITVFFFNFFNLL